MATIQLLVPATAQTSNDINISYDPKIYKKMQIREHIYLKCGMYLDSDTKEPRDRRVLYINDPKNIKSDMINTTLP